jgi:hypothetical protein
MLAIGSRTLALRSRGWKRFPSADENVLILVVAFGHVLQPREVGWHVQCRTGAPLFQPCHASVTNRLWKEAEAAALEGFPSSSLDAVFVLVCRPDELPYAPLAGDAFSRSPGVSKGTTSRPHGPSSRLPQPPPRHRTRHHLFYGRTIGAEALHFGDSDPASLPPSTRQRLGRSDSSASRRFVELRPCPEAKKSRAMLTHLC